MPAKAAKRPAAKKPAKKPAGRAAPKSAARKVSSPAKRKPVAKPRVAVKAEPKPARRQSGGKTAQAAGPVLKTVPKKTIPRPKPKPKPRRPVVINIGDEATAPVATRLVPYRPVSQTGPSTARDHVSGIVCSIREIRTGRTVKTATGDMNGFVFEVLDNRTFDREMSSPTNSDSLAARRQVQALLQKMSQRKEMPTLTEAALAEHGLAGLDGWRIVKVHSAEIEPVAPAGAPPSRG